MKLRGADLIAFYLSPDRLPVQGQWSRKHAHTQRRLCERFAAPVIEAIVCQDITTGHMQKIVNVAPTPGEGDRVDRPGNFGGSDPWEDARPWQHSGSIQKSCAIAR